MIWSGSLVFILFLLQLEGNKSWILSKYLDQWYEPWEVCLFTKSNITDPKYLRDWCWRQIGGKGPKPYYGQCKIGGARFGRNCATADQPYSEKLYLQMSYNEELDNPSVKILGKFGKLLEEMNGTFFLFGDSQMKGFELGVDCEISKNRAALNITRASEASKILNSFLSPNATIDYLTDLFSSVFMQYDHLFFLVNFGVHYNIQGDNFHQNLNSFSQFQLNVPVALKWLNELGSSKNITVAWIETYPQHFQTSNGYFSPSVADNCAPIRNPSRALDWRNTIIEDCLKKYRLTNIHYVYSRDIFLPLVKEHHNTGDCTHYCYWPMLYQPIYEQLYHILASVRYRNQHSQFN
jgi:hypothetical protein